MLGKYRKMYICIIGLCVLSTEDVKTTMVENAYKKLERSHEIFIIWSRLKLNWIITLQMLNCTHVETVAAIFLINGLCIVYRSLLQCLTLVYLGWGQKSEFFCLLVTTRRLQSGTVVGYHSTTTAYCRYMAAKGHWSTPG